MKCEKCNATISPEESFEYAGQTLCEDCYLDFVAAPKTCDPWAVYTAKKETGQRPQLTPLQDRILSLIKEKGPLTAQEICRLLNLPEAEFKINFTTLRHMELARAFKDGNDIRYTTFRE